MTVGLRVPVAMLVTLTPILRMDANIAVLVNVTIPVASIVTVQF